MSDRTHVSTSGEVCTWSTPKFRWVKITYTGKVHYLEALLFRWNFHGGTWEKPQISYLLSCGPQRSSVIHVPEPAPLEICARCDSNFVKGRVR